VTLSRWTAGARVPAVRVGTPDCRLGPGTWADSETDHWVSRRCPGSGVIDGPFPPPPPIIMPRPPRLTFTLPRQGQGEWVAECATMPPTISRPAPSPRCPSSCAASAGRLPRACSSPLQRPELPFGALQAQSAGDGRLWSKVARRRGRFLPLLRCAGTARGPPAPRRAFISRTTAYVPALSPICAEGSFELVLSSASPERRGPPHVSLRQGPLLHHYRHHWRPRPGRPVCSHCPPRARRSHDLADG
jgi:hypothetical protein